MSGRPAASPHRAPLGAHLLGSEAVTPQALDEALAEQERSGGRLGDILISRGLVDAHDLSLALATQEDLPSLVPEYEAVPTLPPRVARELRAVVLAGPSGPVIGAPSALVAVTDLDCVPGLEEVLGRPVQPRLTDARTLDGLLADAYAHVDAQETHRTLHRGRRLRALRLTGRRGAQLAVAVAGATALALDPFLAVAASVAAAALWWLLAARRSVQAAGAPLEDGSGPALPGATSYADAALPSHTLLLPLLRESPASIVRLDRALRSLDYPAHKLQAVALLDPSDRATRRYLRDHPLPAWVVVLTVSHSAARSEEGVLLYGLRQARGRLVSVATSSEPPTRGGLREAALLDRAVAATTPEGRFARGTRRAEARRFLRARDRTRGGFRTHELRVELGWEPAAGPVAA